MLQSKPIVLSSSAVPPRTCSKRAPLDDSLLLSDDDVLILDEPRRWTKKRRLLGKTEKKCLSGGEDDSGTEPGSSSSSSGSPSDGECCECPNDSGCDEEDEEDEEEGPRDKIEELCWQLKENFKENNVSLARFEFQVCNGQIEFVVFNYLTAKKLHKLWLVSYRFIRKKSVNHWKSSLNWARVRGASSKSQFTLCCLVCRCVCAIGTLSELAVSVSSWKSSRKQFEAYKRRTNTKSRDSALHRASKLVMKKKLCSTFGSFAFFTSLRCFVIHFTSCEGKHTPRLFSGARRRRREEKINLLGTIMKLRSLIFM